MIENGAVPKMAQLRVFFILSWTHEPCVPTVYGRKLLLLTKVRLVACTG